MKPTRRSFLALVAAALSVPQAELAEKGVAAAKRPPRPGAPNPILPGWWRHWTVADQLMVPAHGGIEECLFEPPIPQRFRIRSLSCILEPHILHADATQLLNSVSAELWIDGVLGSAGPLFWIPQHSANGVVPFVPELAPRGDFRLRIKAPALRLTEPANIWFAISGVFQDPDDNA